MSGVVMLMGTGESVKRGLGAAMVAVVAFGTACTGSARPLAPAAAVVKHPPPRQVLFGFDTYVDQQGDVEGTRLVRLDPVSLRDQPFSSVKLGDTTFGHVFSPDRRSMAVGALNNRDVVVIDLVGYRVAATVTVVRPSTGWPSPVSVVSWPRADRLLVYTQPEAAHTSYPAQLEVVDPRGIGRVVRTEPLGGSVIASVALADGRAAFLVAPAGRVGKSRLVIADPDGTLRAIALAGIPGGFGPFDGGFFGGDEEPGLAIAGGHAYVVGASDAIADVDLGAGRVSYHAVPGLMADRVPDGPPLDPGSGGIMTNDSRTVASLGGGLLSVTGGTTRPAHGGTQNQNTLLSAQIVDTATWTVRRTLHDVTQLVAAHGLYYCWFGSSQVNVFEAVRPDGRVVFRRTSPDEGWDISAGRLFEAYGDGVVELDPLTGRVLRRLAPTVDRPLDLVPWTRP